MTESMYLEKYGKDSFIEAEKESLRQDFKGVLSLAGSAVYYDEEMQALKEKYDIIWLDVEYNLIVQRKKCRIKNASNHISGWHTFVF